MTNTFDFYAITAISTRKRDLLPLAAGTSGRILTTTTRVQYGRKSFPRKLHEINVGFVDLYGKTPETARAEAERVAAETRAEFPHLTVRLDYHARD